MTAPIRLAILGVGLIGQRHLAIASQQPSCKVIAAADVMASARLSVEAHGARFYDDHRELLSREQLDACFDPQRYLRHVDEIYDRVFGD